MIVELNESQLEQLKGHALEAAPGVCTVEARELLELISGYRRGKVPCADCGGLRDEHDRSRRCEGFRPVRQIHICRCLSAQFDEFGNCLTCGGAVLDQEEDPGDEERSCILCNEALEACPTGPDELEQCKLYIAISDDGETVRDRALELVRAVLKSQKGRGQ